MDSSFLHILAIIILIAVLCILGRIVLLYVRNKRITDFTLSENDTDDIYDNVFIKFILSFSKVLKQLVIFNGVAHSYDKYINENSLFKKGIDYIAIKILLGTLLSLIYIISSMLYINSIVVLVVVILFLIGLLIPDMYLLIKKRKKEKITDNDILKVVIIMSNSFRANKNSEQALKDAILRTTGNLKEELQIVLKDTKLGLSYSSCFMKMKKRLGLSIIDELVNAFILNEIAGVSLVEIFSSVEDKILRKVKLKTESDSIKKYNVVSYVFFAVLPLIIMTIVFLSNYNYYNLLKGFNGLIVILCEVIVYIIYLLIIMFIEKGHKYE